MSAVEHLSEDCYDIDIEDAIERYYIISKTDSDTRSNYSIDQLTQEVSTYTVPKVTTHQLQSLMKKFLMPENVSSRSGNDGDSNNSDSDNYIICDMLSTRKQKRPLPAYTIGRKQHS